MTTPFTGRVLPWSALRKLGIAPGLAAACLLLFFFGMAARGIRTDLTLRPILWGALLGAAGFAVMWVLLLVRHGHKVVVDDGGVRITGAAPIALGVPRTVSHGRFDRLVGRRRDAPHLWTAVEGADGRVVVFVRVMGGFARLPDWPKAPTPNAIDRFDSSSLDPIALDAALHAATATRRT